MTRHRKQLTEHASGYAAHAGSQEECKVCPPIEENQYPKIVAERVVFRAVPKTPEAQAHWEKLLQERQSRMWPEWSLSHMSEERIRECAEKYFPGYALERQRSVTYEWEIVE